jgi:hypothetical protein
LHGWRGIDDPKACLPPLVGQLPKDQLLTEIYTQRKYELFGTGSRWEDSRRRNAIISPRRSEHSDERAALLAAVRRW